MTPQKLMTTRAWVEMALLGCIWGGSFLANRLALEGAGVAMIVALRVGGGAAALWAWVIWRGLPVPRSPVLWGAFLVMGLFNNVLPFTLITWGQRSIEAGLAAILNAATALMGVLVAALAFRDERLTPLKAIGVATGFAGVVTVIGPGALLRLDLSSLSQLAVLVAALSYALSGSFARATLSGLDPEVAAAGMLTASAAIMGPAALIIDGRPDTTWSPTVWSSIFYLALAASGVAYLILYRLIRSVGAGNAGLTTLLVAPVGITLGAVALGEALPARAYLGVGLLAIGLLVIDGRLMAPARPSPPPPVQP